MSINILKYQDMNDIPNSDLRDTSIGGGLYNDPDCEDDLGAMSADCAACA